jgi:O-antigen/teichoic acid export membrane protein
MDIVRSTGKLTLARATKIVIGFFALVYFANKLGAERLGVFFLFQALLSVLTLPANFGINGAVEKRISEGEDPDRILGTAIAFKAFPLSITALFILLFGGRINEYVGGTIAMVLAGGIFLNEYANLTISTLNGELRVGDTAFVRLIKQLVWVPLGVVLVETGGGPEQLALAFLAGVTVQLAVGAFRISTSFGQPSVRHLVSIWDFAKYNVITSLGTQVNKRFDILTIGYFLGPSPVAAYKIAWRITSIMLVVTNSFVANIVPRVSSWYSEQEFTRIEKFVETSIYAAFLPVIPGVFGIFLLSNEVLGIIFGIEYVIAAEALIILSVGMLIKVLRQVYGRVLTGLDKIREASVISLAVVTTNIVGNLILVPRFELVGAALATSSGFLLGTVLLRYLLDRSITLKSPIRRLAHLVFASAIMYVVLQAVYTSFAITTVVSLFAIVCLGVIVYVATVLAVGESRRSPIEAYHALVT